VKWISVRERQPEKGKRVLVCIQTRFGTQIDIRRHLESGRFVHFEHDGTITHWMKLPEPPEGVRAE
jgi:hypothetical protein